MRSFATTTELLPHQVEAVAKLLPSRVGALFMEMGTGKSRTAIELVRLRARKVDRVLWFCPVSLKETVRHEILKHTDCAPEDVCVFGDKTDERTVPKGPLWYVIGLESVSQSRRVALTAARLATKDSFAIVDESSYIKGHEALRTRRLIVFCEKCRYRMILTGTPMTQGVPDLFSQMYFLSPKILGYRSWYTFEANHLEYDKRRKGLLIRAHDTQGLAEKMQPYVFQVTKGECLSLPEKLYDRYYFELTPEQERAYAQAKSDFADALADEGGDSFSSLPFFYLFTSLQSIVCGFWRYRPEWWRRDKEWPMQVETLPHRRIECMMDVIGRIPSSEKVIIWAKYRHCVEEIVKSLNTAFGADAVAQFHGGILRRGREAELEKFRTSARFLVATQSCGGHGLTLNEASYVIFYADGFKYSERLQAEDRCHRIGQSRPVTYITLSSNAGIENRIAQAIANKSDVLRDFKAEIDKVKEEGIRDRARKMVMEL